LTRFTEAKMSGTPDPASEESGTDR
jgi:hypothetical protein